MPARSYDFKRQAWRNNVTSVFLKLLKKSTLSLHRTYDDFKSTGSTEYNNIGSWLLPKRGEKLDNKRMNIRLNGPKDNSSTPLSSRSISWDFLATTYPRSNSGNSCKLQIIITCCRIYLRSSNVRSYNAKFRQRIQCNVKLSGAL